MQFVLTYSDGTQKTVTAESEAAAWRDHRRDRIEETGLYIILVVVRRR